ncbi:hypothetical protein HMSSN139_61360 [Paenibacillus sp. HMSSN-139]|nr:hypothetical protein HMSSN139_61360 [Paenibacillus sp. HMSSN-139]
MIQQSIARLEKLVDISQVFIVTNGLYAELIKAQIPHLPHDNIIIEPVGRNTAPCIGLASILIEEKFPDSTMIVLPSDHIIENEEGFVKILNTAVEAAQDNKSLVTLGIQPTYPETGYGYIESTNDKQVINELDVLKVNKFVENLICQPQSPTCVPGTTTGTAVFSFGELKLFENISKNSCQRCMIYWKQCEQRLVLPSSPKSSNPSLLKCRTNR